MNSLLYKADPEPQPKPQVKVVIKLTRPQMLRLEQQFKIDTRTTEPIQAAIQLGQQAVLSAIRDGFAED